VNSQLAGLSNEVHHADVIALTKVPFGFFPCCIPMFYPIAIVYVDVTAIMLGTAP